MAKKIDLSGLRKKPVKKKANTAPKKDDLIVEAIHKEEVPEVIAPQPAVRKTIKKPVPKVVYEVEVPEKVPVKRVTLDLPVHLHTKLKLHAVTNQTTIRKFVIELLEEVLE